LDHIGSSCNAQFLELSVTRDHKKVSTPRALALFYEELMQCKKYGSISSAAAVHAHKKFANKSLLGVTCGRRAGPCVASATRDLKNR
jgi:hypothetical protein